MYCPHCGQERISHETNFCSRCGYLLTGTADLLNIGGALPAFPTKTGASSPKTRGMKQGVFILLLTFLIVPLAAIFSVIVNLKPWPAVIAAITLFVGGLLRIAYAALFESPAPGNISSLPVEIRTELGRASSGGILPPQRTETAAAFTAPGTGRWRDTNELEPHSITEKTTRHLEIDKQQ